MRAPAGTLPVTRAPGVRCASRGISGRPAAGTRPPDATGDVENRRRGRQRPPERQGVDAHCRAKARTSAGERHLFGEEACRANPGPFRGVAATAHPGDGFGHGALHGGQAIGISDDVLGEGPGQPDLGVRNGGQVGVALRCARFPADPDRGGVRRARVGRHGRVRRREGMSQTRDRMGVERGVRPDQAVERQIVASLAPEAAQEIRPHGVETRPTAAFLGLEFEGAQTRDGFDEIRRPAERVWIRGTGATGVEIVVVVLGEESAGHPPRLLLRRDPGVGYVGHGAVPRNDPHGGRSRAVDAQCTVEQGFEEEQFSTERQTIRGGIFTRGGGAFEPEVGVRAHLRVAIRPPGQAIGQEGVGHPGDVVSGERAEKNAGIAFEHVVASSMAATRPPL
jgi:hypothetical protein